MAGRPTTLNGQPIRTRPCADLKLAFLYATTPHMFQGERAQGGKLPSCHAAWSARSSMPSQLPSSCSAGPTEAAFNRVRDAVRIPMYGCDCYAYGLLAAGLCDLVVEADLKPYDYMALVPIIKVGAREDVLLLG